MSELVEFGSVVAAGASPMVWAEELASRDAELIAACAAARAAVRAFDDAARGGASFGTLCDLSVDELRAVRAVSAVRSSSPLGIAEKALLLQYYFSAAGRSDVSEETFKVAVSLASDAVELAKAMTPHTRARPGLPGK